MSAVESAIGMDSARPRAAAGSRDLRLDFFRGLALLMIFVDHVSGNQFAAVTLQSLGFADAAEVFVFIAGMAAVFAYRKAFNTSGFVAGSRAVFSRIRTLYVAHIAMVAGVLAFAVAVRAYGSEYDIIGKLGLHPLVDDPVGTALLLPVLAYLPHYLDILPLYIVLLAALPAIIVGLRVHVLLPVSVAAIVYVVAQATGITLPNLGHGEGWFFNPFAWGLLFVLGSTAAALTLDGYWKGFSPVASGVITLLAAVYVVVAFLQAEPWRVFTMFAAITGLELALYPDKALLSWHRLLDLLAKAWLVSVFVPRAAAFMGQGLGGAVSRAGRNSLTIFIAGTFLSLVGSVLLFDANGAFGWQVAVTFGGIAVLLGLAWMVENVSFRTSGVRSVGAAAAVRQAG